MYDNLEQASGGNDAQPENRTKYPNDAKILVKLIERNETINSQDSRGYTPLHRAAELGNA